MLKELHIEQFSFKPLRRDTDDKIEEYLSFLFNTKVSFIKFYGEIGRIEFTHLIEEEAVYESCYDINSKIFYLSYKCGLIPIRKFDPNIKIKYYHKIIKPILERYFKCQINDVDYLMASMR